MKTVTIEKGLIENKERLMLYFPYDCEIIELLRTIPGARWNRQVRCWHISVLAGGVEKLNRRFGGKLLFEMNDKTVGQYDGKKGECKGEEGKSGDRAIERSDEEEIKQEAKPDLVPEEFTKTMTLKNYSPNTIRTYKSMLNEFLHYYQKLDPELITDEQIREYLLFLIEKRDVSNSYQNQSINAIKFYYEQVLGRPVKTYYIQRPKKPKVLPNVLSEGDVAAIIKGTELFYH